MGWWTLGGRAGAPMAERVTDELSGPNHKVTRIEGGGRTWHALVSCPDGVTRWAVCLIESGMVKTLDETAGPYCDKCSPGFYAAAVKACQAPGPETFSGEFRARMAPVKVEA